MKTKSFFAMLAMAVAVVACTEKPGEDVFKASFDVKGATLQNGKIAVEAAGAEAVVTVTSNVAWEVSNTADWVSVDPAKADIKKGESTTTEVHIAVAENAAEAGRSADLVINVPGYSDLAVTVKVEQAGFVKPAVIFDVLSTSLKPVTEVEVPAEAASFTVICNANVSWKATASADWLTLAPAELSIANYEETPTSVKVDYAANAGDARTATVTFSAEGAEPVAVTVKQAAAKPNLTFEMSVADITAKGANVSFIPSDKAVWYLPAVESEGYVSQFATGEELIAADLKFWADEYASEYSSLAPTFKEFFFKYLAVKDDYVMELTQLKASSTYVPYVFAVDEDMNPISDLFKAPSFTTSESEGGESDWYTADDLKGLDKGDLVGSFFMYAHDYYEDEDVYWPVTITDGGNSDDCEWLDFNLFVPYEGAPAFRMEWYNGYTYFDPGAVAWTWTFSGYDFAMYALDSVNGKVYSKGQWMVMGYVEEDDCLPFVSYPDQSAVIDGYYVACSATAMCAYTNLCLVPGSEAAAINKKAITVHDGLKEQIINANEIMPLAKAASKKFFAGKSLRNISKPTANEKFAYVKCAR